MFELSRGQVLVYAVVAVVIVVVGLASLRGSESPESGFAATTGSPGSGPGERSGSTDNDGGLKITAGSRLLVVDVAGAVKRPGVYRFPDGARVIDAIRKAGGTARGSAVESINRAAPLTDGQQVVVPAAAGQPGEGVGATAAGGAGGDGTAASGPVSLGTATTEQLEQVDGIGPVTAGKIIEFRDSKGGLGSIEELDQVSGIGPVTMESLRSALQP